MHKKRHPNKIGSVLPNKQGADSWLMAPVTSGFSPMEKRARVNGFPGKQIFSYASCFQERKPRFISSSNRAEWTRDYGKQT